MKALLATAALALSISQAQGATICAGCEYDEGAAATFLGAFNSARFDIGTFQNSNVGRHDPFENFWVFDVAPQTVVSIAAGFTFLAPIGDFIGELYRDDGSICGATSCTTLGLGSLLDAVAGAPSNWEIIDFLPAGRYILRIAGEPNRNNNGAYGGQISFLGIVIPISEPATLMLLGLGLIAVWVMRRGSTRLH